MEKWICQTCGTQFPPRETPPPGCPICQDARQYVGHNGQQWTTLAQMQAEGFHNIFKEHEPSLIGIGTEPKFAIGQRALLVQTPEGNILWDCISLLDEPTTAEIRHIRASIEPYRFERLYSAWFDTIVESDAREATIRSADRYILALEGILPA